MACFHSHHQPLATSPAQSHSLLGRGWFIERNMADLVFSRLKRSFWHAPHFGGAVVASYPLANYLCFWRVFPLPVHSIYSIYLTQPTDCLVQEPPKSKQECAIFRRQKFRPFGLHKQQRRWIHRWNYLQMVDWVTRCLAAKPDEISDGRSTQVLAQPWRWWWMETAPRSPISILHHHTPDPTTQLSPFFLLTTITLPISTTLTITQLTSNLN